MDSLRRAAVLQFAVMVFLICTAGGCSKEPVEKAAPKTTVLAVDVPAELKASESLIKFVPAAAYGFLHWNSRHPAYRRLAASPWAGGGALSVDSLTVSAGEKGKLIALLQRAGIDLTERTTYETLLAEAVAFASPAPTAGDKPALALLFRADSAAVVSDHAKRVREELEKARVKIQEHDLAGASVYSFNYNDLLDPRGSGRSTAGEPRMRFIGWRGNVGAVATKLWPIELALSQTGAAVPANVDTPQFKEAVAGFPPAKHRYATGYMDIAALLDDVNQAQGAAGMLEDAINLQLIPFKAAAFSLAMDDAPSNLVRLLYEVKDPEHKKWFRALHTSSSSGVASSMPEGPLVFFSVDARTLRDVKHLAGEATKLSGGATSEVLGLVDSVRRLALYARVAPVGQAILPIPDVLVALETDDSQMLLQKLQNIIGSSAQSTGLTSGGWQEKELFGTPVKYIRSQLGVGAYMAAKDGAVVLASTEPLMRSILEGSASKASGFAGSVSSKTQQVLAEEDSLGNIYIDLQEVGSFMENMGNMLSMYAPQGNDAQKLLSPEAISKLKKMGAVVASVTVDDSSISLSNFYEAARAGRS